MKVVITSLVAKTHFTTEEVAKEVFEDDIWWDFANNWTFNVDINAANDLKLYLDERNRKLLKELPPFTMDKFTITFKFQFDGKIWEVPHHTQAGSLIGAINGWRYILEKSIRLGEGISLFNGDFVEKNKSDSILAMLRVNQKLKEEMLISKIQGLLKEEGFDIPSQFTLTSGIKHLEEIGMIFFNGYEEIQLTPRGYMYTLL